MRRQLTAYVSEEDFARLKHEAEERRTSFSRHIKERLLKSTACSLDPESGAPALSEAEMAAFEKRIIDANQPRSCAVTGRSSNN